MGAQILIMHAEHNLCPFNWNWLLSAHAQPSKNNNTYEIKFNSNIIFFIFAYRDILREIQRLRVEQEQQAKSTTETQQRNPTLLAELHVLRQRRDELEGRMSALQESRRELMVQLEGLMKLLKVGLQFWIRFIAIGHVILVDSNGTVILVPYL